MKNYEKLQAVLREIFEIDKADLDFGIYRIMNQKRADINKFIEKQLPKDIKEILRQTQSKDSVQLRQDLDKLGSDLDNAGVVRENSVKYVELKKSIESSVDLTAMEQEIFSHLTNFFKRYYKEGDFISQRRYKKDVYAIPYEGEEVKLHWVNADQYYIKTSEYLKNYAFLLSDKKKVIFQLKEASTEQNNNKTQGDGERRFAIYEEVPVEVVSDILYINFTYEMHKKSVKQDALIKEAFDTISSNMPVDFAEICATGSAPTEKNKNRTILEKHLNDYVSRNTFDYFIHKDLGGFLRRELDFYIKNEILYIDDINTENPAFFIAQLSKIKAFKTVADKIVSFLAQIEDFQKKLWLKKKFVIRTDYCITMDKIPAKYYEEIFSNAAQLKEWESLFSINFELNNSQLKINNEEPIFLNELSEDNLPASIKYAVIDTQFFSEEFKDQLIAEFYNLDEETNGLLINSENFQALNLMQDKYKESIKSSYQDPPYNTSASEIIYKNSFKHSSWLSFINDRLILTKSLLKKDGLLCVTIDDFEFYRLKNLIENIALNHLGTVVIRNNPAGRSTTSGVSITHEYALFYGLSDLSRVGRLLRSQEQLDRYNEADEIGPFEWVNYRKPGSMKSESPTMFYPIGILNNKVMLPSIEFNSETQEWEFMEDSKRFDKILYPIDENNQERRWRWGIERFHKEINHLKIGKDRYGELAIYSKGRLNESGILPFTWWEDKKYSSTAYGTNLIKDLFVKLQSFAYPKSIYAVSDSLRVLQIHKNEIVLDIYAGSGTTAHATIKLNREDQGNRKYILVEMGTYFNTVTKPRVQKVIHTDNWKNGKPQDTEGISQLFKYQVLESYEDTLNNLVLAQKDLGELGFDETAQEEYLLKYMLDVESRDHLFDIEIFKNPFDYKLKVTESNELIPTKVDLVETFNYLIGLYVEHMQRSQDIKFVEGTTRAGEKTLVIWRNLETTTNEETIAVFRKLYESERTSEFDQIYINGDHNLANFRIGEDQFKVKMIEEAFFNKMFDVTKL